MRVLQTQKFASPQSLAYASGAKVVLPQGLEQGLPIAGITLNFSGRLTVSAQTTAATFFPEALSNLLGRVKIYGNRKSGGKQISLVDAFAAELYAFAVREQKRWPRALGITPLGSTSVTSFDFKLAVPILFASKRLGYYDQKALIIDPAQFSLLQLEIDFGADTAYLFEGGSGITAALHAYGSATGVPSVTYSLIQVLLGGESFGTAYVSKISQSINLSTLQGNATDQILQNFKDVGIGTLLKSLQFRQYQVSAAGTGIVDVTSGSADFLGQANNGAQTGITQVNLKLNSKDVKHSYTWDDLQEYAASEWGLPSGRPKIATIDDDNGAPNGYGLLDFTIRSGSISDAWDLRSGYPPLSFAPFVTTTSLPASSTLDVMVEKVQTW